MTLQPPGTQVGHGLAPRPRWHQHHVARHRREQSATDRSDMRPAPAPSVPPRRPPVPTTSRSRGPTRLRSAATGSSWLTTRRLGTPRGRSADRSAVRQRAHPSARAPGSSVAPWSRACTRVSPTPRITASAAAVNSDRLGGPDHVDAGDHRGLVPDRTLRRRQLVAVDEQHRAVEVARERVADRPGRPDAGVLMRAVAPITTRLVRRARSTSCAREAAPAWSTSSGTEGLVATADATACSATGCRAGGRLSCAPGRRSGHDEQDQTGPSSRCLQRRGRRRPAGSPPSRHTTSTSSARTGSPEPPRAHAAAPVLLSAGLPQPGEPRAPPYRSLVLTPAHKVGKGPLSLPFPRHRPGASRHESTDQVPPPFRARGHRPCVPDHGEQGRPDGGLRDRHHHRRG